MNQIKTERFGKYLLIDKIGAGGMAELYRAKMTGDKGFEKLIAVKKILPHLVGEQMLIESFIDEARLAAFLQHENIILTYDFGKMESDYFIAMEYLFGKNLKLLINTSNKKKIPLEYENIVQIISCICNGLDYAHSLKNFQGHPLNIIHRDISPPNIFITYSGEVKIIDFGIAKAASQNTTTRMGVIKGKIAYMSPEQAAGKDIDYRSDIFAVGALLYELVTGKPLYRGETLEVLNKAAQADFKPPEKVVGNLPPSLSNIINRSLAKNPDDRYKSCGEMLADIDNFISRLSLRPATWVLARYMKELFDKEIDQEEKTLHAVARLAFDDDPTAPVDVNMTYDKTVILTKKDIKEPPVKKKVCILGSLASGKTSIARRFVESVFTDKYQFTMGVAIHNKQINFEGQQLCFDIWDLGGYDHASEIQQNFLQGIGGYFLVIDYNRDPTLETAIAIQKKVAKLAGKVPFVCLLNKIDLSTTFNITNNAIEGLKAQGWTIIKTSAKTGLGINKAFSILAEKML